MNGATGSTASAPADESLYRLMDELTVRLHGGAAADVEEFLAAHPEHAARLRDILPALEVLADLGNSRGSVASASAGAGLDGLASADLLDETGSVLGDFRIVREIGRGGMGIVYEAEQLSLRRRVALKVLPFAAVLDPRHLQRFKNEALAAASLRHANIVPVYAVGCERGVHYYAMQYIRGQTLAEAIAILRRSAGSAVQQPESTNAVRATDTALIVGLSTAGCADARSEFRAVAAVGVQLAEALEHAHAAGVIHRDIKPSNILLDDSGVPWITDFGLAQLQHQASLTATGLLLGTARYMSPEQASGESSDVDRRTDIYSLGATLYELLTLQPAFHGSDAAGVIMQVIRNEPPRPSRVRRGVPPELETIILTAMARESSARYATAAELADDLRRFLDHRPIHARRASWVNRTRKWCRRNRVLVNSAAVMLLLTTVGLVISALLVRHERELRNQREVAAKASEESLRQHRYAVSMNLAAQAWNFARIDEALEYLKRCVPERGQTDLRGFEWRYLWKLCHTMPPVFARHAGEAYALRFSPDGTLLATGGQDGARVWQFPSGEQVAWLRDHGSDINAISFSDDGRVMATSGDDLATRFWDTSDWSLIETMSKPGHAILCMFAPAGGRLAIGEQPITPTHERPRSRIRVVDWSTRLEAAAWDFENSLWDTAWSSEGRMFAVSGEELVRVQDLHSDRQCLFERAGGRTVCFVPNQRFVAAGDGTGRILFHSVEPGAQTPSSIESAHLAGIEGVDCTSDGGILATAGRDQMAKIWTFDSRDPRGRRAVASIRHDSSLWSLRMVPDDQQIATVGRDGTIRTWKLDERQAYRRLGPDDHGTRLLAFTADSHSILIAGRILRIVDAETGQESRRTDLLDFPFSQFHLSPSKRLLLGYCEGVNAVTVWDAQTLVQLWSSSGAPLPHSGAGQTLWSAGWWPVDDILLAHLWPPGIHATPMGLDPRTGEPVAVPRLAQEAVEYSVLSSDSRWLAYGTFAGGLVVIERQTGRKMLDHLPCVALAASPDSRWLATASRDGMLRIWNTSDWTEHAVIGGLPHDRDQPLAFSPDSRTLAYASARGRLRLFNVATGRELLALPDDAATTLAFAFSSNGRALALSVMREGGTAELVVMEAPDSTVLVEGTPAPSQ